MDLLNLFPGIPEGQRLLMPHPLMAEGGSVGWSERGMGGDGGLERGEHAGVSDDAGREGEGGR